MQHSSLQMSSLCGTTTSVTACTLILIIKEPVVNLVQVPDVQPVQMGNVELCIIRCAVCNLHEVLLREFHEPQQLGASTDRGLDVLVHLVHMQLETYATHVIIKLDIKNVFNEVTCAVMICMFEQHPNLWSMVSFLLMTHSPKLLVFYASGKRAKPCTEGSRQGAAEAGIAALAVMQHCWLHHFVLGPVGNRQAAPRKGCIQGGASRSCAVKETSAWETSVRHHHRRDHQISSRQDMLSRHISSRRRVRSRRCMGRCAFKEA